MKTDGHVDVVAKIEHEILVLVSFVRYVTPGEERRHQHEVTGREILWKGVKIVNDTGVIVQLLVVKS